MKILTICPTKSRYELCKRMLNSFLETKSQGTDIIFSLDDDDPQFNQYRNLFSLNDINFFEIPYSSVTYHINKIWETFPEYDYYHITNDDVEYKTKEWGRLLITNKEGVFYGNDLLQEENLPTFPIISRRISQAVGWLQCPYLDKYFGDTVWKYIATELGCLYYNPTVIIEHHHNINNKRKPDNPNYEQEYNKDQMAFANWVGNQSLSDKRKVTQCLMDSK